LRIISLDPGTTTGVVKYVRADDKENYYPEQIGPEEHHKRLYDMLVEFRPAHVVYEQFEFRPNPGRKLVVLDSREYIGIIKLYSQTELRSVTIKSQTASQAKAFWTDDKIKTLALWTPGKKHAMDAMRHILYYQTFTLGWKELLDPLK
jgi:hypothetical protein